MKINYYFWVVLLILSSPCIFAQNNPDYTITFEEETGTINLSSLESRFQVVRIEDNTALDPRTEYNITGFNSKLDEAVFNVKFLTKGKFKVVLGDLAEKEVIIEEGDLGRPILIPIKLSTILSAVEAFDIITQDQIKYSGRSNLTDILHYYIPGVYGLSQTIADGTDQVVPIAFRGLSPDQLLVLINGKPWNGSALLNINGTVGRGTVGKDLNVIPVIAVNKIEFFKAGAATFFGSDAIAGVINIILKEAGGVQIDFKAGNTYVGDGSESRLALMNGIRLKNDGFVNFCTEYIGLGAANRSGAFTGPIFGDARDNIAKEKDAFFKYAAENFNLDQNKIMKVGRAATQDASFLTNGNVNISDSTSIYFFGGINFRKGYSSGFYRLPFRTDQVVTELYPYGFLPEIQTANRNGFFTIGSKKTLGKLTVDISNSYGQDLIRFNVNNSNNVSLDTLSPFYFNAGGLFYQQNVSKIDVSSKLFQQNKMLNIRIRAGAEVKYENYKITQGEESSYLGSGAEVFPGFQPDHEVDEWRRNLGAFVNTELKAKIEKFTIRATGGTRYEKYSDFKQENFIGRAAGKITYNISKGLNASIRSSWNQGFRAPSLQQRFFSNRSIQSQKDVFTFGNSSPEARLLGILPLEPEYSTNVNFGAEISYYKNKTTFYTSIDYYQILIKNRIVLSGRFNADNLNQDPTLLNRRNQFKALLTSNQYEEAQGFINGIETLTKGLDISSNFKKEFSNGYELNLLFRGNFYTQNGQQEVKKRSNSTGSNSETALISSKYLPALFVGRDSILFNREEIIRYEDGQPQWRTTFVMGSRFKIPNKSNSFIRIDASWNAFGSVATDQDGSSEVYQKFEPKFNIFDINISYLFRLSQKDFTIGIGGNNLLNSKPGKNNNTNLSDGRFVYNRRAQQYGMLGGMWFIRLGLIL